MCNTLGILITSEKYFDQVSHLAEAACAEGKDVRIVFSGTGVLSTLRPEFEALAKKVKISICDVSFRAYGLDAKKRKISGLSRESLASQGQNAEMLLKTDRCLVF